MWSDAQDRHDDGPAAGQRQPSKATDFGEGPPSESRSEAGTPDQADELQHARAAATAARICRPIRAPHLSWPVRQRATRHRARRLDIVLDDVHDTVELGTRVVNVIQMIVALVAYIGATALVFVQASWVAAAMLVVFGILLGAGAMWWWHSRDGA